MRAAIGHAPGSEHRQTTTHTLRGQPYEKARLNRQPSHRNTEVRARSSSRSSPASPYWPAPHGGGAPCPRCRGGRGHGVEADVVLVDVFQGEVPPSLLRGQPDLNLPTAGSSGTAWKRGYVTLSLGSCGALQELTVAIEIPNELKVFLQFIGVLYPEISEDVVRTLAEQVETFTQRVSDTYTSATGVIQDMGSVYSGYSYEQLVASWAQMSTDHLAILDKACNVVATGLRAAADVIVAVKVAVLAELTALAGSFMLAMTTPGGSVLAFALREATRRLCSPVISRSTLRPSEKYLFVPP